MTASEHNVFSISEFSLHLMFYTCKTNLNTPLRTACSIFSLWWHTHTHTKKNRFKFSGCLL